MLVRLVLTAREESLTPAYMRVARARWVRKEHTPTRTNGGLSSGASGTFVESEPQRYSAGMSKKPMDPKLRTIGISVGLGMIIGVVIGTMIDNVGLGVALGVAFGAAVGATLAQKRQG